MSLSFSFNLGLFITAWFALCSEEEFRLRCCFGCAERELGRGFLFLPFCCANDQFLELNFYKLIIANINDYQIQGIWVLSCTGHWWKIGDFSNLFPQLRYCNPLLFRCRFSFGTCIFLPKFNINYYQPKFCTLYATIGCVRPVRPMDNHRACVLMFFFLFFLVFRASEVFLCTQMANFRFTQNCTLPK